MEVKLSSLASLVISENEEVLSSISDDSVDNLVSELCKADNVVCYGAGRMGLSLQAFSMRLNHLGINSGFIGKDTYIKPVTKDSVFLAASGSGKTKSVLTFANIAKSKGARVMSIVGDLNSPLADLSDYPVWFRSCNGGLHSLDNKDKIDSIQPMSTLNEQALYLLLDIVTLLIINKKQLRHEDIVPKHFNIE